MRLRWTLALAFLALAVLQAAVVVPLALRNVNALLNRQHEARLDVVSAAVEAEGERLRAEVERALDELAQSAALEDVARDAASVPAPSHVTQAAARLMTPRGLDVLALLDDTGRTLSSGHLPARLGEPADPLFLATKAGRTVEASLVELPGASGLAQAPALVTARAVDYGDRRVWVVGGVLLNEARATALSRLTGARVEVLSQGATVAEAGLAELPVSTRERPVGAVASLRVSLSRADLIATRDQVLTGFLGFSAFGLLLSVLAGFLVAARITRPVEALTSAATRIARGEPGVRVEATASTAELATLVDTFNTMTADLKQATDQLVASERIAAWQEVARRLAHEIKNPLTPIRMSLETLVAASRKGALDERFQTLLSQSAGAMLEEVARLTRIVDEFSRFARLPRPQLAPIALDEVVSRVMALYAPHGAITFRTEVSPCAALADADQIAQILVNLIKNAEEAMGAAGGAVTVRLTQRGDEAVLEVEDEGPGIADEVKARIFEPYVTSKPQGSGLGLAIAQRIAAEHQGRLEVADGADRGALFRLILPLPSVR